MTSITIYLDNATEERLRLIADGTGRRVEDLAESAVSEEALSYFRSRHDDPGREQPRASLAARRFAMEITP